MKRMLPFPKIILANLLALCLLTAPLSAQDEEKPQGWSDTAEFSFVATDGNTETSSLGFKNKLWREWDRSAFELNAGGIRVETTTFTRFAVGSLADFSVVEDSDSELTAENYYLNGQYDRKITNRFIWYAGAGWDRNEFAGIQNRYTGSGGVGNIWVDREDLKFHTNYGLTYTKQDDVVENPDIDDTFWGARFSWVYLHKFGDNTTYGNDLILDENLDETSDFRANMTNWVAVSMSKRLALKLSLQWLYDNDPSFEQVDLFDPGPPLALIGEVPVELDDLDTIFTASLVINF